MAEHQSHNEHKWHADRAGERPDDDRLGRKEFAIRVARELRAWRHKDSLVLSLNGEWGAGKTTLVNLILFYIGEQAKAEKEKLPNVIRFNPWQWSAQDKVLAAFFDEIGAGFNSPWIGKKKARELEHLWKGLKIVTVAGKDLANRIRESMTAVAALLAGGSGILASVFQDPTTKHALAVISLAMLGVATACAVFAPIAETLAKICGWWGEEREQTIEEARRKLREKLAALEAPMIVVIDDVDRLNKREVRMLVQLVKANADFPNVIYFLVYQKSIIANALQEVTGEGGQEFLKKIVQIELEVPAAPEHLLRKFFNEQISPVILGGAKSRWDKDRWGHLFEDAVWPWFETPRDIKRFKSMLEFYYEAHVLDGVLEVNPIDLVLLEILRVFDPVAYEMAAQAFQNQGNLFIGFAFESDEWRKRFKAAVDKILERTELDQSARERLRSLLVGLFPQGRTNSTASPEEMLEWFRDLRICHPKMFPRYFQLGGNPGDVTDSFLNRLFAAGNDRASLRELLKTAFNEGRFNSLMERIRSARKDVPSASIEPLITAFFDLSDELEAPSADSLIDPIPERELTRMVIVLLRQIVDRVLRLAVLRGAALASEAVTGPVMAAAFLEPEKDQPKPDSELLVDLADLKSLQTELLPRLWAAAQNGRLWKLRSAGYLLYRLRNWAGISEVKQWLAEAVNEAKTANAFLEAMLAESQVSGGGDSRTEYMLPAGRMEEFISLEELSQHVSPEATDILQKRAIEKLKEAVDLKKAGKPFAELYVMSRNSEGKLFIDGAPPL